MSKCIPVFCLLLFSHCMAPRKSGDITRQQNVIDQLKVAEVWSGHPVGFDIVTEGSDQFIAYYDADRNMCIAHRDLKSKQWNTKILPSKLGWDSHNSVVIALDRKGYIHLSGNMHGVPLVYFRSQSPRDIDKFDKLSMVGSEEKRVTYPVFFKNNENDLFYQYRDGGSGNGITYINRYDANRQKWSRVLDQGLFDGEDETNAYPTNPIKGPDGYFHYMWVWRLNPIANTNHNLSYARTKDFVHFENITGESIPIPIKYRERRVIADPIGPWNGLMNSSKVLSFDSNGKVIFGYHKFDKEGRSQLFLCHYLNDEWVNKQVSNWPDYTWEINERGSLGAAIGLHEIKSDGQGHIYLSYSHVKYGSGLLKVDENNLQLLEDMNGKRFEDISGLPISPAPDMQLRHKTDATGKFMLQWQTLPTNFDRPREPPYPEASELILYELE